MGRGNSLLNIGRNAPKKAADIGKKDEAVADNGKPVEKRLLNLRKKRYFCGGKTYIRNAFGRNQKIRQKLRMRQASR